MLIPRQREAGEVNYHNISVAAIRIQKAIRRPCLKNPGNASAFLSAPKKGLASDALILALPDSHRWAAAEGIRRLPARFLRCRRSGFRLNHGGGVMRGTAANTMIFYRYWLTAGCHGHIRRKTGRCRDPGLLKSNSDREFAEYALAICSILKISENRAAGEKNMAQARFILGRFWEWDVGVMTL